MGKHNGAWFRFYTDFNDNPKVRLRSDATQLFYVRYLCLWKDQKVAVDTDIDTLSFMMRCDRNTIATCLEEAKNSGLLLADGTPKGWEERQYTSDNVTERVKKWRKQKDNVAGNVANSNGETTDGVTRNVACNTKPSHAGARTTDSDSDTDTELTPIAPKGEKRTASLVGFDTFWSAYPNKVGKDAARKAWAKRQRDLPPIEDLLQALAAQKRSDKWTKDNGQYVPNPATWINQGRWQDGEGGNQLGSGTSPVAVNDEDRITTRRVRMAMEMGHLPHDLTGAEVDEIVRTQQWPKR